MAFNDLPSINDSHAQSEESELALLKVLKRPKFISRKENPDYGADFIVELSVDKAPCNCRFQVQLKSEETGTYISDGQFITVRIETSTLNYLNRFCGEKLIALYDASKKKMYYQWLQEILDDLNNRNKGWQDQETVTVRIPTNNELVESSAGVIHDRALKACKALLEEPASATYDKSPSESSKGALSSTSSAEDIMRLLISDGVALVSAGLHIQILDILDGIAPSKWIRDPQILLVRATAHDRAGYPLQALHYANLALAARKQGTYTDGDSALLERVRLDALRAIGTLSTEQFFAELKGISKKYPDTIQSLQATLDEILKDLIVPSRRDLSYETIRPKVDEARKLFEESPFIKEEKTRDALELLLAKIESVASDQIMFATLPLVRLAEDLGAPIPVDQRLEMAKPALAWKDSANTRTHAIWKRATTRKDTYTEAYALLIGGECQLKSYCLQRVLRGEELTPKTDRQRKILDTLLRCATDAERTFKDAGYSKLAYLAAHLGAEVLDAQGRKEQLEGILAALKREGTLLGLKEMPLSTQTAREAITSIKLAPLELAKVYAGWTDDDITNQAKNNLALLKLPPERLPNMVKELKSYRSIGKEKLAWCKHLELLQQRTHLGDPGDMYTEDISRKCSCLKFKHESQFADPDADLIIRSFKSAYCEGCEGREI